MEDKFAILQQANATLGEGPLWDQRNMALYWIDIRRHRIHRFDAQTMRQNGQWVTPTRPGCIALSPYPDILLLAAGIRILKFDLISGQHQELAQLPVDGSACRANDGAIDAHGRLWVGTMLDDFFAPERFVNGKLFCVLPDGKVSDSGLNLELPNGIGWSPDETIMYLNDTAAQKTYRFDFDSVTGSLGEQTVLFDHSGHAGYPDGLAIDAQGNIWSAQWDGWNIKKISPEGALVSTIQTPVRRPSSIAFFGIGLDHLAVTSATVDFTTEDFLQSPDAGALFTFAPGTHGQPEHLFGF